MANPTKIKWTPTSKYTDGSTFAAADYAGMELVVDGKPAVAVPVAFGISEFDIASLALALGAHTVQLATVATNGTKSALSNSATFTLVDTRVPQPPLAVSAV